MNELHIKEIKILNVIELYFNGNISDELALEKIDKISSDLGEFLQKGLKEGLNLKEGLGYIKQRIEYTQGKDEEVIIVQNYSPKHDKIMIKV